MSPQSRTKRICTGTFKNESASVISGVSEEYKSQLLMTAKQHQQILRSNEFCLHFESSRTDSAPVDAWFVPTNVG